MGAEHWLTGSITSFQLLQVIVIDVAWRERVNGACHADDATLKLGCTGLQQQRLEKLEKVEMRQVVDAEVCLAAILRPAFRRETDT